MTTETKDGDASDGAEPVLFEMSVDEPHPLYHPNRDSPRAAEPKLFAGKLRPVQAALLHGMLELEARPVVQVKGTPIKKIARPFKRTEHVRSPTVTHDAVVRAARLAEQYSAGKTALSLALIAARTPPLALPARLDFRKKKDLHGKSLGAILDESEPSDSFVHYPAATIPATLVVVASSVHDQWLSEAARFTPDLRILSVANARTFAKMAETVSRAQRGGIIPLAEYDCVIVRVAAVAAGSLPPWLYRRGIRGKPTASLLGVVRTLTAGYAWSRVIIDDFDTIKLTCSDTLPPANFTWYISATDNTQGRSSIKKETPNSHNATTVEAKWFGSPDGAPRSSHSMTTWKVERVVKKSTKAPREKPADTAMNDARDLALVRSGAADTTTRAREIWTTGRDGVTLAAVDALVQALGLEPERPAEVAAQVEAVDDVWARAQKMQAKAIPSALQVPADLSDEEAPFRSFCATIAAAGSRMSVADATRESEIISDHLRFLCTEAFAKEETRSTKILARRYIVAAPAAARIARHILAPGGGAFEGAREAAELAEAGAYGTAATRLGFAAASPEEFIRRALERFTQRIVACRLDIQIFKATVTVLAKLPQAGTLATTDNFRGQFRGILRAIKKGIDVKGQEDKVVLAALQASGMTHVPVDVNSYLAEVRDGMTAALKKSEEPLQRLRAGMGEEECHCCDVEFIGGAIIMGCCQRLLCDDCMFEGDGRRKAMLNACPFCRAPITKEGITRIDLGADAQLTEIIDDDGIESALFGDERKLETESAEAAAAAMPGPPPAGAGGAGGPALPDIPAGFDARLRGLLAHVQGRDDIERYIKRDAGVVADLATPNIIDGSEDIEPPAHAPRRYLIFVLAPELVGKVVDSLSDIGQVPCVRQIAGTFVAKARAKREFLSSPVDSALVVAASTDCGGMNLPQVTDLIILGRLVNSALRGQAISRAQRVGRTANLRLLQIWTDAEEGLAAE